MCSISHYKTPITSTWRDLEKISTSLPLRLREPSGSIDEPPLIIFAVMMLAQLVAEFVHAQPYAKFGAAVHRDAPVCSYYSQYSITGGDSLVLSEYRTISTGRH